MVNSLKTCVKYGKKYQMSKLFGMKKRLGVCSIGSKIGEY